MRRVVSRMSLWLVVVLGALVFVLGLGIGAADAKWLGSVRLERAAVALQAPYVAFGPQGQATLALNADSGVQLVRRARNGRFSRPVVVARGRGVFSMFEQNGVQFTPEGLALPAGGATVLWVRRFDCAGQCLESSQTSQAYVEQSGSGLFAAPQTLAHGDVFFDGLLADARGEVIDCSIPAQGSLTHPASFAVLGRGESQFGPPLALYPAQAGIRPEDDVQLAADGVGGVFAALSDRAASSINSLTGDMALTVLYRGVDGPFGQPQVLADREITLQSGGPIRDVAIAAGGNAHAAVAWIRNGDALDAAVGGPDGFGSPQRLALAPADSRYVLGAPQIIVDTGGRATVAWSQCDAARCEILVAITNAHRRFGPPHKIATAGGINPSVAPNVAIAGDPTGDLVLAWQDLNQLKAIARAATSRGFGTPHTLTTTSDGIPIAAYGPRGEAIVAWAQPHQYRAAVYQLSQ